MLKMILLLYWDFQQGYYVFLELDGLKICQISKQRSEEMLLPFCVADIFTTIERSQETKITDFVRISNIEIQQFCSSLAKKDAQYLI